MFGGGESSNRYTPLVISARAFGTGLSEEQASSYLASRIQDFRSVILAIIKANSRREVRQIPTEYSFNWGSSEVSTYLNGESFSFKMGVSDRSLPNATLVTVESQNSADLRVYVWFSLNSTTYTVQYDPLTAKPVHIWRKSNGSDSKIDLKQKPKSIPDVSPEQILELMKSLGNQMLR